MRPFADSKQHIKTVCKTKWEIVKIMVMSIFFSFSFTIVANHPFLMESVKLQIVQKQLLILYSIDTHFDKSSEQLLKTFLKTKKLLVNKQFLLFPQCFLLNQIIVSLFVYTYDIISLFATELEEPKIGI